MAKDAPTNLFDDYYNVKVGGKTFHYKKWDGMQAPQTRIPQGQYRGFNLDALENRLQELRKLQVEEVCKMLNLTLAREILWAEEAVDKFKDDYYPDRPIEFRPSDYEFKSLKRQLWQVKVKRYIIIEKAKFFGREVDDSFKEEQDRLTAQLVAHRLTHGAPPPLTDDDGLTFKNFGVILPKGKPASDSVTAAAYALMAQKLKP